MARTLPKKSEIATDLDWKNIRENLDSTPWTESSDNPGTEERTCYIGTVFSLYPSGKYYLPFACSNVDPCPRCGGRGNMPLRVSRRVEKKWRKAVERAHVMAQKRRYAGYPKLIDSCGWGRYYRYAYRRLHVNSCSLCEGVGSYEALLDQKFGELLEKEAEQHGCYVVNGEGDPCDIFVAECRDTEEADEDPYMNEEETPDGDS